VSKSAPHDTAGLRDGDATVRAAERPQFHAHNSIPWTPSWHQAPTAALPTLAVVDAITLCVEEKIYRNLHKKKRFGS